MNEFKESYTFQYSDGEDRSIYMSFNPGDTWPEVLEQFVSFMSNVYGYDIHSKVGIKVNPLTASMLDETWTGPVFDLEDCL